ncbi:MAG: DUF6329 domain-containing protein [Bacteroidales bacterium]
MKALFGRKVTNIKELKDATLKERENGYTGLMYEVIKEVSLDDSDFKEFANDFLEDQPWIEGDDGGVNSKGEIRCIRVINAQTGERILVNSEGYDYPRYTAIEE